MNFKKGDKVKFLYQNDHGTITRVIGEGKVMVLNSDDFEVPAMASELILDASAKENEEPKAPRMTYVDELQAKVQVRVEAKKQEQKASARQSGDVALYAGFVPADGKAHDKCDLDLYFVNDSDFRICYNYCKTLEGSTQMQVTSGILEPDTKEYVETIKRGDLSGLSVFKFQLMFAQDRMDATRKPEECELRIHAPKFYQLNYYKVNDFFDENAVILPIYQSGKMADAIKEMIDSQIPDKDKPVAAPQKKAKRSEKEVVDLHLTEIIEDERGMSPKEILDYQMKVFREKLEEYIKDPVVKKVIFIHGKGNGTLKIELRKCLERNYKRCEYQDASFEEYGGGATLVYVK
ncbi:MAG: DUF2027 domain-containing protein [Bacteroidales bacterium]|nr:DUF2027 domain-containing protein [Bacteroidales bacterium]